MLANDGQRIKVFPNVNADGIEGVALRPAVVILSMSARRGSGCA